VNVEINMTETLAAWGFRIAMSPDELTVTRDVRAYNSTIRMRRAVILFSGIALSLVVFYGKFIRSGVGTGLLPPTLERSLGWIPSLLLSMLPLILAADILYPDTNNLRCTREHVEVTRLLFGKVRNTLSFSTVDVKQVRYVDSFGFLLGPPARLEFQAGGKQVKCLQGLKCVEAQRILDEFERMGFDIVRDPRMPVMLEMERSLRSG